MQEKTCIVVPCYNESGRFKTEAFVSFLKQESDIDFCCVNDGSIDGTLDIIEKLSLKFPGRIYCVSYEHNQGKAEAVRLGVQRMLALKRYGRIGFADADLATPFEEIRRLVDVLENEEKFQMVMGSRVQRMGVKIERRLFRHYMGRLFATVISVLFRLHAYDTQCGAKIFRADIAKAVFEEPFLSKWLFDVEILLRVRSRHSDYNRIIAEIPLDVWLEQGNSKIRFTHLLKMPFQLWKIYLRYRPWHKKLG